MPSSISVLHFSIAAMMGSYVSWEWAGVLDVSAGTVTKIFGYGVVRALSGVSACYCHS